MKFSMVPACPCPWCGEINDAATSAEGDYVPIEGSYGMCWSCKGMVRYDAQLLLCKAMPEEIERDLDAEQKRLLRGVGAQW